MAAKSLAILFIICAACSLPAMAQTSGAPGSRLSFYDEKLRAVKDRKSARFAFCEYYDNGQAVFRFRKRSRRFEVTTRNEQDSCGLFTGKISFYNSRRQLIYEEHFASGRPLLFKAFEWKDTACVMEELIDYRQNTGPGDWTFVYRQYCGNTLKESAYFRKGPRGWGLYEAID
jgi:hypothetical protein